MQLKWDWHPQSAFGHYGVLCSVTHAATLFTSGAIATAKSMGGKCLLRVIFEIKAITAQIDIETYVIEVTDFNSEVRFDL